MEDLCHRCIIPDEKIRHFLMSLLKYEPYLSLEKFRFVQTDIVYGIIRHGSLTQYAVALNMKYAQKIELKKQTIEIKELVKVINENNGIVVNLTSYDLYWSNDMLRFVDLYFQLY
jgi:hypothetical protein